MSAMPKRTLTVDTPHLASEDSGKIQKQALELIRSGTRELELDLRSVRYAESVFFGSLIVIAQAARNVGASLVIVCVPGPIREVLRLSSLDRVLEVREQPAPR